MTATTSDAPTARFRWQTPTIILVCGCIIAALSFGPRSALGQFLTPLSIEHGWGRDVFSVALAVQNLLWGAGQPFAGALADRFGAPRVLSTGAILYGLGLATMSFASTPGTLELTSGVLIGFGLSAVSFTIVIGALGKLMPPEKRVFAFGAGTAAGSFGQFLFSPLARVLIDTIGWHGALVTFGAMLLFVLPLSLALAMPSAPAAPAASGPVPAAQQTAREALSEALRNRSYRLLVLGFFTCGFQLAFVTVHLPAYLIDRGLTAQAGALTIALIGLFNIVGSITSGYLSGRVPKRYVLSVIYVVRSLIIVAFILLPASPVTAMLFGAAMGLMWLSTVPPTNGIVMVIFGTRWLTMLGGVAFFSHQVGGFLGVLIGGLAYERTGSYDVVWWLSVLFGLLSAVINLPIVEKPVPRLAAQRA